MAHRTLFRTLLAAAAALTLNAGAQAQEKFTYMTNWYAQAEHGGFYQAVATGIYKKYGLDVTIRMGGPQVNILQLMAAGQTDCIMGSSDIQMMVARNGGVPVVTNMPYQVLISKPRTPASANVGTWGNSLLRVAVVKANGLNLPALIWPMAEEVVSNMICTLPPMMSRCAWLLPR